jgi:hypothetical protein
MIDSACTPNSAGGKLGMLCKSAAPPTRGAIEARARTIEILSPFLRERPGRTKDRGRY